jgi:signal transduction histidine kinase
MSNLPEKPDQEPEITDLDTARLALRGALQTVRNLQDVNARLKGDLQDYLHREKILNERMLQLQAELSDSYARLDKQAEVDREKEAAQREALRKEIIADQNQKWQAEVEALRQSVQNWVEIRREKETELRLLKEALLQKEAEVFSLQKDKLALEEKAHLDMLQVISQGREAVYRAVEAAVADKDKEIAELKKKIGDDNQLVQIRLRELDEDYKRKTEELKKEFNQREKDLWDSTQKTRETLDYQLKTAWEDRLRRLEQEFENRRTTLEAQWSLKDNELQQRMAAREAELHHQWTDKETALARDWMAREKQIIEDFQKKLDQERQRASDELARVKSETEVWRHSLEQQLHQKEVEMGRRQQAAEEELRTAWRRREEDLLKKHQEASDQAQRAMAEMQARYFEKEASLKAAQEKLEAAQKEHAALADQFAKLQTEAAQRQAALEEQIRIREQELNTLTGTFTARDEERTMRLEALQRAGIQQESELRSFRARVSQLEADRNEALERAVALQNEFDQRRQELEIAARTEISRLQTQLNTLSQSSTEREQAQQVRIAEVEAQLLQKTSELQGMADQLSASRADLQKLTERLTTREFRFTEEQKALDRRLKNREAELQEQLLRLNNSHQEKEDALQRRLSELESDLAQRLAEFKALEDHLHQTDERRQIQETNVETLRAQLEETRKEAQAREAGLLAQLTEAQKQHTESVKDFQQRILAIDGQVHSKDSHLKILGQKLAQIEKDRKSLSEAANAKEVELQSHIQFLQESLYAKTQELEAKLEGTQREHLKTESALRSQIDDLMGQLNRQIAEAQELKTRLARSEQEQQENHQKAQSLEGQLTEHQQRLRQQEEAALKEKAALDQQHLQVEQGQQKRISELEGLLSRKTAEAAALQEQAETLKKEASRQAEAAAAREAQLSGEIQSLAERLQTQKEQSSSRLASQEKEFLQTQENLQRRLLDVEEQLARKTSTAKSLSDRLQHLEDERTLLEKKISGLESQLVHSEEALKAKLEEFQASAALNQKEQFELRQAYQKQLQDLENSRISLDAELKGARETLAQTAAVLQKTQEEAQARQALLLERARLLEEQMAVKEQEWTARLSATEAKRTETEQSLRRQLLELDEAICQKAAELRDLQQRSQSGEAQSALAEKKASALHAELTDLQTKWREEQEKFRVYVASLEKQHLQTVESLQQHQVDLESQLMHRESVLRKQQEQMTQLEKDHKAISDQSAAEQVRLSEKAKVLEDRLRDQEEQARARLEVLQVERLNAEASLQKQIGTLQEEATRRLSELQSAQESLHQAEQARATLENNRVVFREESARSREALEQRIIEERAHVEALEKQLAKKDAELRALQDRLSRLDLERDNLEEQHAQDLQKVQKELLDQLKAVREESEQALRRVQKEYLAREQALAAKNQSVLEEEGDWNRQRATWEEQFKTAEARLEEQKRSLQEQERQMQERAEALSKKESQLHASEKGTEQLREQLMSALQSPSDRLGQSAVMQSLVEEWVFGFAHQVRNPLGIIRSVAESILESGPGRRTRSSLEAVLKAVDGLNERLKEFIEFSKPVRPFLKPLQPAQATERAAKTLQERLERSHIELKIQLSEGLPELLMDPDHVHTILVNLLANGADAMPEGGQLEVTWSYDAPTQTAQLCVKDEGKGISAEHLEEVGKPFFSTKTGAAGLGLAIIKRLLRAYEGELTVESTSGQGTTLTCCFHAKKGDAAAWAA